MFGCSIPTAHFSGLQNRRAAGYILLVDARTKEVVGKLTSDQSLDDMSERASAALAHLG